MILLKRKPAVLETDKTRPVISTGTDSSVPKERKSNSEVDS